MSPKLHAPPQPCRVYHGAASATLSISRRFGPRWRTMRGANGAARVSQAKPRAAIPSAPVDVAVGEHRHAHGRADGADRIPVGRRDFRPLVFPAEADAKARSAVQCSAVQCSAEGLVGEPPLAAINSLNRTIVLRLEPSSGSCSTVHCCSAARPTMEYQSVTPDLALRTASVPSVPSAHAAPATLCAHATPRHAHATRRARTSCGRGL